MKGCILPFPKKGDLGLAKNYRGITLTSIAAEIYNALLRNRIEPKIDIILRKNQNGFRRNRSTTSQILTIRRILEGVVFVAASHQTRLDTRSKARRPIKVGIKGRGRSGRSRDSNPACQCCSSAHLVQCEPDEASGFTNPNVGPGTYACLRLKLDAWSSAVQRGQKCSSPTRRLPSRSWGPIRPRVCSWFRAPIRHECQTAQLKSRGGFRLHSQRKDGTNPTSVRHT